MSESAQKRNTANRSNAMTEEEIAAFLNERREARLATSRADGSIHLTPVWYVYEDRTIAFCLEQERLHLRNLRRDPRASMLIDDDQRPVVGGWSARARAVMFAGSVEIIDDPNATEVMRRRMLARYVGDDAAIRPAKGMRFFLIRLTPVRVLSWDFGKNRREDA